MAKILGKTEDTLVDRVKHYFSDTRAELRKVTWPTREAAWNLTLIVLGVTVFMALVLGTADWGFSAIMRGIVNGNVFGIVAAVAVVVGGGAALYFSQRE